MAPVRIELVRTEEQAIHVRTLARAFVEWLLERYPEREAHIRAYLIAQCFEEQLANLLVMFTPPSGECLLVWMNETPVGIVMLKSRDDGTVEMNRMFVLSEARGLGVGRALCDVLIEQAKTLGYKDLLLTALPRHREAIALYRSLGFVDDNRADEGSPDDVVSMKMHLT